MYCSTCGARTGRGESECRACGAALEPRRSAVPARRGPEPPLAPAAAVPRCPRCGFEGDGLPYFARGGHVAALVAATVLTAGMMGAAGIVYYLARRDHRLCPRCGHGWGPEGELARVTPERRIPRREVPVPPARRESVKRGGAVFLYLVAAALLVVAIAAVEPLPGFLSLLAATGATALHLAAARDRDERRAALLASLQLPVLHLAAERGGRLTVTEVAAELGWTLPRAEKVLRSLDDGVRVDSEVTDEGLIVYEFRELRAPGPDDDLPWLESPAR